MVQWEHMWGHSGPCNTSRWVSIISSTMYHTDRLFSTVNRVGQVQSSGWMMGGRSGPFVWRNVLFHCLLLMEGNMVGPTTICLCTQASRRRPYLQRIGGIWKATGSSRAHDYSGALASSVTKSQAFATETARWLSTRWPWFRRSHGWSSHHRYRGWQDQSGLDDIRLDFSIWI